MVVISCIFFSCNADHGLFLFSDTEFPYVFNKNLFVYYVHAVTFFWYDQVAGGWILEGQKRWIGNSTFADVLVIFARNTTTNQINA